MTPARIVIVGTGPAARAAAAELSAVGIADLLILDRDVVGCVFDDGTDSWALRTAGGERIDGRVVIACQPPPFVPWTPKIKGQSTFRGPSFHAAAPDDDFDPAGKRLAVVGVDSGAAGHLHRWAGAAASVTVFAHPPRRIVTELPLATTRAKRWLRRRLRPAARGKQPRIAIARSSISAITPGGLRTNDGVEHRADALVYGTGFAVDDRVRDDALAGAGGVTLRQAWHDGMEPCFGIAVHGFPNYFFVTGPDFGAQARHAAECVRHMDATGSTRIEVRRSSQQVFNERACVRPAPAPRVSTAFELSCVAAGDDGPYDGAATLSIAGTDLPVRVRLTGHLDPIDGQYHWQGTVFSSATHPLPHDAGKRARTATLTVNGHPAPARLIERTPWGTHTVAGVGAPPYARTGG
ncbi:DUF4873 domain-containing protein [Mycobacterium parmense]|uniref:DUF4873 domain-containing protein n=1 Tax=Mycobacterium parmense TaxID=185642 RepID=A0A7I7Z220_9MYCO|nr:DUF4873 domain-containing protein [Mycobacterium parmense]BBZ48126.1 hypothetical protein MPRM_54070 [Mycobacterium parmense]